MTLVPHTWGEFRAGKAECIENSISSLGQIVRRRWAHHVRGAVCIPTLAVPDLALPHQRVEGVTQIGPNNVFYQNVTVGVAPQDLKYDGAPTETIVGYGNVFRENVTVHRGTELGGGKTIIGNENLLMVGSHVAHDCYIANRTIIANQVQLAGHVTIEDYAVIEALLGINQFVTVGRASYVAAMTPVRRDVPPFMKFSGDPNEVRGVNEIGLKRIGFADEDIEAVKEAYRLLFRQRAISAGLDELGTRDGLNPHVGYLCDFMRKSCASRFSRFRENERGDSAVTEKRRMPVEVRTRDRRKVDRK